MIFTRCYYKMSFNQLAKKIIWEGSFELQHVFTVKEFIPPA